MTPRTGRIVLRRGRFDARITIGPRGSTERHQFPLKATTLEDAKSEMAEIVAALEKDTVGTDTMRAAAALHRWTFPRLAKLPSGEAAKLLEAWAAELEATPPESWALALAAAPKAHLTAAAYASRKLRLLLPARASKLIPGKQGDLATLARDALAWADNNGLVRFDDSTGIWAQDDDRPAAPGRSQA